MRKLKSKIAIIVLIIISLMLILNNVVNAKTDTYVTDLAERGYDTVSTYSASTVEDIRVLDEPNPRQMHAQTLCSHKSGSTDIGSYTAIRVIVDIEGSNAVGTVVSSGNTYNLGSSSTYAAMGFIAAVAEAEGSVSGTSAASFYQNAYRYFYPTFKSDVESGTGCSLVTDSYGGSNNDLAKNATSYASNGATLTADNVAFIKEETGVDFEVGQTAKARIFLTGAEYEQSLNILTGIFDGEITADVGVEKEITRSSHGIEIEEEANFKITVTNHSDYDVTVDLVDEYDTDFYEYVGFTGNDINVSHSSGTITATITIPANDYYEYTASFTSKASATPNYNYYNEVTVSNLVVNGNSIEDSDTSDNYDSDYYYVKDYSVGINKFIYYVGSTSYASRETDKSPTVYAETGDEIVYAIKLSNNGSSSSTYGNIKNVVFTDTIPSDLTDIKYSGGSSYSTSLPSGWSVSGNTYTYSSSIAPGSSATLYIKGKLVTQYDTVDKTVTNTATISSFENKNNKVIYSSSVSIADCSPSSSSDTFTVKAYKVTITKTVDLAYVETGDTVTYTIKVKNAGSGSKYGSIKGISINDVFNTSELEYLSMSGTGWSKSSTEHKYTYSESLSVGSEATLTLKFKVIKMSKTNDKIKNTTNLLSVKNKHDLVYYSSTVEKMAPGSTFKDSVESTLKIYTLNVNKDVVAVYNKAGTKLSGKTECEIGDVVEFQVDVTNAGSDNNLHGRVYEININDYYDNRYFDYNSISGTGWTVATAETASGNTSTVKLKYTNSSGLANGSTASFKIKLKVLDNVNPTLLTSDVTLTNTAEIKSNDIVKNKNDINIRSVLNGDLIDDASLTLRSYNSKVNKYITKLNGNKIEGRDIMTVASRNNTPVEVEKYDVLVYTFRIDNPTGAALHNITITDTLKEGLEYTSATASVKSAKKCSASNTAGTAITITESNTTTGSKTFNYSGSIGAGEYILIEVECKVVMTNLHLPNIENEINITEVYNRNNIDILSYIQYVEKENKEYVRLKNLIISGTVWVDKDKGGLINDGDVKLEGIKVTLRDVTNGKYTVTYTDENGYYIFGGNEPIKGTNNNGTESSTIMIEGGENKGRVIKGTNRNDTTGNYSTSSTHIEYYVEFEYNGVTYKPTKYANQDNLNSDYSYNDNYVNDSNAIEFNPERDALNRSLETIAYNKGYHKNGADVDLEYSKSGHESDLLLNEATNINAYSFVSDPDGKVIDNLFLSHDGETEYLKYINLGLEEREVLDLQITKDLVESNVSINGYDMKYLFNKLNHNSTLYYRDENNDNKPDKYELAIYETDHKYRYDMYEHAKVQEAKGKEASELQVELVYNIVVKNTSDRPTYAKVNEIIDTYTNEMTLNSCTIKGPNGETPTLTASDDTTYNTKNDYAFDGYRTKFITGMNSIMLEQGKSFTIELRYSIDKDSNRSMYIFGDYTDKVNVAQIGSYSTYEADKTTPKGLVDGDSNVGNLRKVSAADSYGLNDFTKYEDTAFRVDLDVVPKDEERKVTGYVFEDTRSEKLDGYNYYTGNGMYQDGEEGTEKDGINTDVSTFFGNTGMLRFTKQDVANKIGYTSHLDNFKIAVKADELIQDFDFDKKLSDMTVELVEIIEYEGKIYEETIDVLNRGNVIVRTSTDDTGTYTLSGFIPATYVVRFKQGDIYKDGTMSYNSLTHNGQDYKSTTYTLTYNNGSNTYVLENTSSVIADSEEYNDIKYAALTQKRLSDARGNELRRLEIMGFSEVMTNERAEELKYTHYLKSDGTIDMAKVQRFANETSYFADTVTVSLGIENKAETIDQLGVKMAYMQDFSSTSLLMPNVDYGVTYRPENFLELKKSIHSIKLTPVSETEPLVYIEYNEDGTVNTAASTGTHNVQSIDTTGTVQGFRYINIDEDLLQGAKLEMVYKMVVSNIGEVDIVSKELANLGGASKVKNELQAKYRDIIESTTISGESKLNYSDAARLIEAVYNPTISNYEYGIFVGDIYYRGTVGDTTDVDVVSITVNKILDFVDNDATFIQDNNSSKNQFWATTTEEVLLNGEYKLIKEESLSDSGYFLDEEHRRYTSDNKFNLVLNVDSSDENESLVKAIVPKIYLSNPDAQKNLYQSSIKIQVDAVLGGDLESEAMVYENIAEIVQFTSPVGRRTNFAGTIGNMEVSGEVEPFKSSKEEPDSDGTEVIRLTPPTGLSRTKLFIMGNINTFLIIITVVIAIGMIYVTKTVLYGRVGKSKFYK